MSKKITFKYIEEYFKEKGYSLITKEYKNVNSCLTIKSKDNYFFETSFADFKAGIRTNKTCNYSPLIVSSCNPFSIKNIKNWIEINNTNFIFISGEYLDARNRNIILECDICKERWNTSWNNICNRKGCPYCHSIKLSNNNNLLAIFLDIHKEWDYKKILIFQMIIFQNQRKKYIGFVKMVIIIMRLSKIKLAIILVVLIV
jgi:hypothetical protein